jgi:ribosomal protein L11 methyltransferase
MKKMYMDILLSAPSVDAVRETLSFQLHELGFSGSMEDDGGLHCYVPKRQWNNELRKKVQAVCDTHRPHTVAISGIIEFQNQNWNRQWEKSIQPIEVTERIIITPSWHPLPDDERKIVLVIDPKMSFGTGYHESTRLMLRMLEHFLVPNSSLLDVGTGTGILAIAAVKLGARFAVGVDTDEWSYSNGKENVARNGLVGRVDIRHGSLEVVHEVGFRMILANITRNAIVELLSPMLEKLLEKGVLLLSGLLADDRAIIEKALQERGCKVVSVNSENEWIGIVARRK